MNLALLVEYYPPSRASAAVQMSDLARALARQGHAVTVFTTSADIPISFTREETEGIVVIRARTGKVKGISLVRRALNEILMPFTLWRAARRSGVRVDGFDGLIWYAPTIFFGPFAAWLKRKSGARAYLIMRDIFPQWVVDAGLMRRGIAYYFFRAFERYQYHVADVIGAQSPANVVYFEKNTLGAREIQVLFNWIDLDRPEPCRTDVLCRHGLDGKRILVYGGNMGVAQDMDNLLRLAERIRHLEDVALLLVGAGSEVECVRRALTERRLANVVLAEELDPEHFRGLLRACHVGLITLDRRLTTHNIPGKLLAYLEASLPVVASVNPGNDLVNILIESGAGIGLVNGEDSLFAETIVTLIQDPVQREAMSRKARALLVQRFSVDSVSRQLTTALDRPIRAA